jgi:uncharacterized membrane protein
MKLLQIIFKPETRAPLGALTFGSAVIVTPILARIFWTGNLHHGFLVWNLFLAWLPLVFALLAAHEDRAGAPPSWRVIGWTAAWLLFFPNAPYICTDLIHVTPGFHGHYWLNLTLILLCAFTGLVLGFVSLYLIQSMVVKRFGRTAGWLFVVASTGLTSFGVYLGRFLRFNSWDVIVRPFHVYRGVAAWIGSPMLKSSAAFLVLFATFLFVGYVMVYALTQLSPASQSAMPGSVNELEET